uniref:SFRICE_015845 n=1 Tax=Spodoptera frugiperda TaxID=7108 RepID=A0A2H1W755_SPOFR
MPDGRRRALASDRGPLLRDEGDDDRDVAGGGRGILVDHFYIGGEPIAIYRAHFHSDSVLLLRNFRKTEYTPVILCPTRESNPRHLVRQSHLRPLDQRGSPIIKIRKGTLSKLRVIAASSRCDTKLPPYYTRHSGYSRRLAVGGTLFRPMCEYRARARARCAAAASSADTDRAVTPPPARSAIGEQYNGEY